MPYIEISNASWGDAWDFEQEGVLEGVYVGSKIIPSKNKRMPDSTIYGIELLTGESRSFWGKTVLNRAMKEINEGERVRITFLGKKTSKDGSSEYYDYRIEKWEDAGNSDLDIASGEVKIDDQFQK